MSVRRKSAAAPPTDPRDVRIAELEGRVADLIDVILSRERLRERRPRYVRAMRWLAGRMPEFRLMLGQDCILFDALHDEYIETLWRVMVQHARHRRRSLAWREIALDGPMTRLERRRRVRQRAVVRSVRLEMRRAVGGGRAAARAWIRGDAP